MQTGERTITERQSHVVVEGPESTRGILVLAAGLFVLYLLTGNYSQPYYTDPFTNASQSRAFAEDLDPILEEFEGFAAGEHRGRIAWFTEAPEGVTSQYPPGVALWAAPFYLFDSSLGETTFEDLSGVERPLPAPSTLVPATVAAAVSVALAMAFFGLTLAPQIGVRSASAAMLVGGLGTSAWSVAANKLWQHGPAMMCLSIGTYFVSRDRFALAGLAFAAGVTVRPHTAVIAACIGLVVAISRRSVKEMLTLGVTSALGVAALMSYNNAVFGEYSISGGYGDVFADRVLGSSPWTLIERLGAAFVHGRVGIVWSSPFIALALFALWKERRSNPDWAVGAALGAFVYVVLQYRANRVTGGSGFFSYRYPIEPLMAAAPMLAISTWAWLQGAERGRRLFAVLATLSILAHGLGSIVS